MMKLLDITNDTRDTYTIQKDEGCVFFMLNRTGNITFELAARGAQAHIFAFFIGRNNAQGTLSITQKHSAPHTTSHALLKSILFDEAEYTYEGLIRIDTQAVSSDASQESRTLLLSPDAKAYTIPALEILASDVKCRHAATASPLNPEALYFAQSRGLSAAQAKRLLIRGFFDEALQKMRSIGADTETIEKQLIATIC